MALVPVLVAIAASQAIATAASARPAESNDTRRLPVVVLAFLTCVGILPFHLPIGSYFESPFQTSVAAALKAVDTSRVRIATTEAGLIPLAVTGPALDTYGHNNRNIARTHGRGLVDELNEFRPNVVALHGLPPEPVRLDDCSPQQRAGVTKFPANWSQMVSELYDYAEQHGLALARISETSPCETWSLWLSDDVDPQVRQAIDQLSMPGTEVAVNRSRPNG
ncbi:MULTISPECIES: hypothetical protein [unclassified Mycobacterium]|uniref:hypothetical protein n=1 Tax=unclassified Mycobacterium TaxID=2642494 RepID=UPI0029C8633D|nr:MULTISPECIES: hypothetical protein [unclassified Mycobacterium]